MSELNTKATIERVLDECKTIAVVGLSSNSMRPSNGVAAYMKEVGYRVIPINPGEKEILGEKCYPDLASVPEKIDLVDIFRRSEFAGETVDQAISVGAKAVWLQDGVFDQAAASRALAAGLLVVMNRCWMRDYYQFRQGG